MTLREDLNWEKEKARRLQARHRQYREFCLRRLKKIRDKITYLEAIVKDQDTPTKAKP